MTAARKAAAAAGAVVLLASLVGCTSVPVERAADPSSSVREDEPLNRELQAGLLDVVFEAKDAQSFCVDWFALTPAEQERGARIFLEGANKGTTSDDIQFIAQDVYDMFERNC
jgi:hypothetical protein